MHTRSHLHTGLARPPPQSPGLHGERTNAQEDDGEYDPAAADDEFAEAGGEGRQRQEAEEEAEFDEAAFDEAERKRRALSGAPVARSQRALCGSCSRGCARAMRGGLSLAAHGGAEPALRLCVLGGGAAGAPN